MDRIAIGVRGDHFDVVGLRLGIRSIAVTHGQGNIVGPCGIVLNTAGVLIGGRIRIASVKGPGPTVRSRIPRAQVREIDRTTDRDRRLIGREIGVRWTRSLWDAEEMGRIASIIRIRPHIHKGISG